MRLGMTTGLAALALAASTVGAQAQTQTSIYVYNFNDASTSSTGGANATAANTASLFSMDRNNSADPNGSVLSTNFLTTDNSGGATAPSSIVSFAGTTANTDSGDAAGAALAMLGGGATGAIANNGKYLQATANLTGFSNIKLSFAAQATSTGFNSDQFQYSLDGQTFINFGSVFTPISSSPGFGVPATGVVPPGAIQPFDLSGIPGLNGDANAAFRIIFNGATSVSGNNRLDNLVISGLSASAPVPEASTTASFGLLLVLGLGGVAIARRRKQA